MAVKDVTKRGGEAALGEFRRIGLDAMLETYGAFDRLTETYTFTRVAELAERTMGENPVDGGEWAGDRRSDRETRNGGEGRRRANQHQRRDGGTPGLN